MITQNQYNEKKGVFFLEANGKRLAEMTYTFAGPEKFIIEHTEVFPGSEGKGYGKMLVKAAVDFAREKNYRIIPLCPYAKSVFGKTEAYGDVLFR